MGGMGVISVPMQASIRLVVSALQGDNLGQTVLTLMPLSPLCVE